MWFASPCTSLFHVDLHKYAHVWPPMKNASHTHGSDVCALTHSADTSPVQRGKPMRWSFVCWPNLGSVFPGAHVPLHALLSSLIDVHTQLIYIQTHTYIDTHFPLCCFSRGKQQWFGTGLFFSAGQSLARPKGGSHTIPPKVPLVWAHLNLHLLRELHFRYIVQASLSTVEGGWDIMLKSTLQDQSSLCTGLSGWPPFLDHVEWGWSALGRAVAENDICFVKSSYSTCALGKQKNVLSQYDDYATVCRI